MKSVDKIESIWTRCYFFWNSMTPIKSIYLLLDVISDRCPVCCEMLTKVAVNRKWNVRKPSGHSNDGRFYMNLWCASMERSGHSSVFHLLSHNPFRLRSKIKSKKWALFQTFTMVEVCDVRYDNCFTIISILKIFQEASKQLINCVDRSSSLANRRS